MERLSYVVGQMQKGKIMKRKRLEGEDGQLSFDYDKGNIRK